MTASRRLLLSTVLGATFMVAPGAAHATGCSGTTLVARGALRIVGTPAGRDADRVYACYHGTRRLIWHPRFDEWEPAVDHLVVSGNVYAYQLSFWGDASLGATRQYQVVVRRLRTARAVSATPLGQAAVRRLVLRRTGNVAWSDGMTPQYPAPLVTTDRIVKREVAAPGPVVLDQAIAVGSLVTTIDRSSLRLDGTTLSWISGGTTRTAQLR